MVIFSSSPLTVQVARRSQHRPECCPTVWECDFAPPETELAPASHHWIHTRRNMQKTLKLLNLNTSISKGLSCNYWPHRPHNSGKNYGKIVSLIFSQKISNCNFRADAESNEVISGHIAWDAELSVCLYCSVRNGLPPSSKRISPSSRRLSEFHAGALNFEVMPLGDQQN